jgi:hypothetical protein
MLRVCISSRINIIFPCGVTFRAESSDPLVVRGRRPNRNRPTSSLSGQKLGASGIIERELLHRSAIEAVIGHLKPRQSRLNIARPRSALL